MCKTNLSKAVWTSSNKRTTYITGFIFVFVLLMIATFNSIASNQHVFDNTGFFSAEEIDILNQKANELYESTGSDLIIITTNDSKGFSAERFAAEYYESVRDYENMESYVAFAFCFDIGERGAYGEASYGTAREMLASESQDDLYNVLKPHLQDRDYFNAMLDYMDYLNEVLNEVLKAIPKEILSGTSEDFDYIIYYDGAKPYVEISNYRGFLHQLDIPEQIGGLPVRIIGNYAFAYNKSLVSVNIPSSVNSIGDAAFCHCDSLTSIKIPNSVTIIGYAAFAWCQSLTSIEIPGSVTSIGNLAFLYCKSLTLVIIPNSVESIGDGAFALCQSLTSINIPDSIVSIGDNPFISIDKLKVNISPIHPYFIFQDGLLIERASQRLIAYIPEEQRTTCVIPYGITCIGSSAFAGCESLTSVEIPNSVTSIGGGAFCACNSLTSIDIPNSVTSIGDDAFHGCSSLASVKIPNSVTSIGNIAFTECPELTLGVTTGSYAERYAKENKIPYITQ